MAKLIWATNYVGICEVQLNRMWRFPSGILFREIYNGLIDLINSQEG